MRIELMCGRSCQRAGATHSSEGPTRGGHVQCRLLALGRILAHVGHAPGGDGEEGVAGEGGPEGEADPLYDQAVEVVEGVVLQ